MILQAMPNVGDAKRPHNLYQKLLDLYTQEGKVNPEKRALGSIGGARNGGTIIFENGVFIRIR